MSRVLPVVKTLVFTVLVPGTVTLVVPHLLLRERAETLPLGAARWVGLPLIVAGATVYLWCAWDFATAGRGTPAPIDPPKELVARGLYRFVRNPMYVGIALILLGEALVFRSSAVLLYAAIVFLFFNLFVFFYEEPALARKFGEPYERYRAGVPRWIPRIRKSDGAREGGNGGKE